MTYIVDFYFCLCFNRTWVVKMIKILEDLERKIVLGNITGNLGKAICLIIIVVKILELQKSTI